VSGVGVGVKVGVAVSIGVSVAVGDVVEVGVGVSVMVGVRVARTGVLVRIAVPTFGGYRLFIGMTCFIWNGLDQLNMATALPALSYIYI
jgi:hypothetical protein